MNEQQLRYIQKIAEEGSIQKASVLCGKNPSTLTRVLRNMEKELGAAEELYLAQPSLSQMVKELEADLGRKVFVRKREGVEETEFGRKLLDPVLKGSWTLAVACPKEGKMSRSSREFLRLLKEILEE